MIDRATDLTCQPRDFRLFRRSIALANRDGGGGGVRFIRMRALSNLNVGRSPGGGESLWVLRGFYVVARAQTS